MSESESILSNDHAIFFAPSGKRARVPDGTSVLEAARKLGVDLDLVCGGRGICGRCQISVVDGVNSKLNIDLERTCLAVECGRGALYVEARRIGGRAAARLPRPGSAAMC